MDNIIISNYPKSGSRYLTALICSRFRKLNNYISKAYSGIEDISKEKSFQIIMKTISSNFETVPYKMIHIVRDPRDIIATLMIEDKIDISELCQNTIVGWIEHIYSIMYYADKNNILFVRYENLIQDEESTIDKIGSYLDLIPSEQNHSRELEMKEGFRKVGLYKDVLHSTRIKQIEEITQDCLNDLEDYL